MKNIGTNQFAENCELNGAVVRGFNDKPSGNFDVCSGPRKTAVRLAYQRAGSVFKEKVRKGFCIGRAYDAGDREFGILMGGLVLLELYDSHGLAAFSVGAGGYWPPRSGGKECVKVEWISRLRGTRCESVYALV